MISPNIRTGYEHFSTVELEEFIGQNRNLKMPSLNSRETNFEKAVREKSQRTKKSEFETKEQFEVNIAVLQKQQVALQSILSELARPLYKTANGWFSFAAMTAAIVGVLLVFI